MFEARGTVIVSHFKRVAFETPNIYINRSISFLKDPSLAGEVAYK